MISSPQLQLFFRSFLIASLLSSWNIWNFLQLLFIWEGGLERGDKKWTGHGREGKGMGPFVSLLLPAVDGWVGCVMGRGVLGVGMERGR